MNENVTQFKMNIPTDLFHKMKEISARESRSMTGQINLALRQFAENYATTQK